MRGLLLGLLLGGHLVSGQTDEPATRAYTALQVKDYEAAIAGFRAALAAEPGNTAWRKDLAYTLLRAGEREQARDEFERVLAGAPDDQHTALEFAYLCFETKREADARRVFDRLRAAGATAELRRAAAEAFENIDRPLREGIARWQANIAAAPGQWSSHEELARLAEQRDELSLAAEHFREAWRLRPNKRELMLDLARVLRAGGHPHEATALLLAASRSAESRAAEMAREQLPDRYPYAYEFAAALAEDPANAPLRREYAYLLLELNRTEEAIIEFRNLLRYAPDDELAARQLQLLTTKPDALTMAQRSLEKSYLPDAIHYYQIALEDQPGDPAIMLGLGRAYNIIGDDRRAMAWFKRASRAGNSFAAVEAGESYRNLRATAPGLQVTAWALPFYTSRWSSGIFYGQVKGEWRLRNTKLRPYLSARLIADTQGEASRTGQNPLFPAYLSETALILGGGLRYPLARGVTLWGEAGQAISYLGRRLDGGVMMPDYRGGVALFRGWGPGVQPGRRGRLLEAGADTVWLSRFERNILTYAQTRLGYSLAGEDWQLQALWNFNVTADTRQQYWANFVESGPGLRLRVPGLPPGMMLRADLLRGVMLRNRFNPLPPNFWDVRAGFWYGVTH